MRRLAVRPVRSPWLVALAGVAVLTVIRNLAGLDSAPQGAYVDETSIGYNAWAISSHAVDEHGARLPLYPTAFGEYKNPVYVYVLSAFLRVLPLTVTTERLPAAIFGLLTCLFITLIAWRRSRSLPLTTLVLALAALTPWLTVESRVGFEVISLVAVIAGALLCLSIAQDSRRWGWYAAAGTLLGIAVFAYSTGRVAVVLLAIALVVAYGIRPKGRARWWMITVVPVVAAYGVLVAWSAQHPGAITARFNAINIWSDGAPLATVAGRFLGNYFTHFGPDFLFISGDHNVRHNTQFAGMLLWIALPLLLAGLVAAWRHRDQPFMRFVVLGLLVAPVSAALTNEGVPHAVRAAVMLPFLLVLCVEGMVFVADHAGAWRRAAYAAVALAIAIEGVLFTVDMYTAWPARSATAFDSGEINAIARASELRGGRQLLLSVNLDQPYIQAAFALRPAPPRTFVANSAFALLTEMNMTLFDPANPPPDPGAVVVLNAGDPIPAGAQLLFAESTPAPVNGGPRQPPMVTVLVYRLR
ncbi:MAG TPA: glycosyltransferase family 39 protein [Candidatus Dormibacteraeota bacterium]|nr:glycosyltransferase family 39 protein [Candidatus Dormibacteraeota bacterium]